MCGRFVSPDQRDLEKLFHVRGTPDLFQRSYNVAPTMPVPMVYLDRHEHERKLTLARWGLVPFCWKDVKPPGHTFNTRLEEASTKPMWRKAFRSGRCIVPASGWYEWQEREVVDQATGELRKYKQPFFMHLPDKRPLGFAGLMAWTRAKDADDWIASCSIITAAASGVAADVHHRMPVVLAEEAHERWLDPALDDPEEIAALIANHNLAGAIVTHAVSTRVNASKADDPLLLEPVNPQ